MEDLHLSLLSPPPFSLPLWLCQAVSTLHFSKSFPTNGKGIVVHSWQGCFSGWYPTVCSFYPLFLYVWLGRKWWGCALSENIISMIGLSDPLVLDLGSVRPRLPSLDSAFLLRRVPLFCILSPLFLSESPPEGERQQAIHGGIAFGAGALFS